MVIFLLFISNVYISDGLEIGVRHSDNNSVHNRL